jgi:hypothetical protein
MRQNFVGKLTASFLSLCLLLTQSFALKPLILEAIENRVDYDSSIAKPSRDTIYRTENIWNSLLLDTKTGLVKQISSNPPMSIEIVPPRVNEKLSIEGRYRLYNTQNIWNFLLLDTYKGKVYQVQFSTEEKQGWWPINENDLRKDGRKGPRFSLQATGNIWTFNLLDFYTGDVWVVHFSVTEPSYRWIQIINEIK